MPDITMCKGAGCPHKEACYRFKATPSPYRQSYFAESPCIESPYMPGEITCVYFEKIRRPQCLQLDDDNRRCHFLGRYRTPEECALRIMNDRTHKGLRWISVFENGIEYLEGRLDTHYIRIKCLASEVLRERFR